MSQKAIWKPVRSRKSKPYGPLQRRQLYSFHSTFLTLSFLSPCNCSTVVSGNNVSACKLRDVVQIRCFSRYPSMLSFLCDLLPPALSTLRISLKLFLITVSFLKCPHRKKVPRRWISKQMPVAYFVVNVTTIMWLNYTQAFCLFISVHENNMCNSKQQFTCLV